MPMDSWSYDPKIEDPPIEPKGEGARGGEVVVEPPQKPKPETKK